MPKFIGYLAVILSALIMGYGEGKIISLQFQYSTGKVIPPALIYLTGTCIYLIGLFTIADKIGSIIGIWETLAIGMSISTAIFEITKRGEKIQWTPEIIITGALLVLGITLVITQGDKFMGYFIRE
jgi:hypothetical protein